MAFLLSATSLPQAQQKVADYEDEPKKPASEIVRYQRDFLLSFAEVCQQLWECEKSSVYAQKADGSLSAVEKLPTA